MVSGQLRVTGRPGLSVRRGPAWPGVIVDWSAFTFAVGLGALTQVYLWHSHGTVLDGVDVAAGAGACLLLWLRRSNPVVIGLIVGAAGTVSPAASGAVLVACATVASRARGRGVAAVAVAAVLGSVAFQLINPRAGEMVQVGFPAFLVVVLAFGWGLYLRTRRELEASLRERADKLEADQRRSTDLAREAERRRIAREMHDVLAHRLSLLSVHAGALEFRADASRADIARAAGVIRHAAADALSDLREVVAVLREDTGGTSSPQPGLAQIEGLLAESRSAGMAIEARIALPDDQVLPDTTGRTVYRVVQEGLTNARKHAPGAPVEVSVTADEDASVVAEVISRNAIAAPARRAGTDSASALPGAGAGLIGLAERLELAGGELEHGPGPDGFVLRARIPAAR